MWPTVLFADVSGWIQRVVSLSSPNGEIVSFLRIQWWGEEGAEWLAIVKTDVRWKPNVTELVLWLGPSMKWKASDATVKVSAL